MKKLLFTVVAYILLHSSLLAQSITITGGSTAEVGIPTTYAIACTLPSGYTASDGTKYTYSWDNSNPSEWSISGWDPSGTINNVTNTSGSGTFTQDVASLNIRWGGLHAPVTSVISVTMRYKLVKTPTSGSPIVSSPPSLIETKSVDLKGIGTVSIAGSNPVPSCCASPVTYTVNDVRDGNIFTWTVPTGWVINSGANTSTITVTPTNNGLGGNVSCQVGRSQAISSYTKTTPAYSVTRSVASITSISYPMSKLCRNQQYTYSINAVCGAASSGYTWAVPPGWSINSGNGTTSIVATPGPTAIDGNVGVSVAFSGGCAAVPFAKAVDVLTTLPAQPTWYDNSYGSYFNWYRCGSYYVCSSTSQFATNVSLGNLDMPNTLSVTWTLSSANNSWKFGGNATTLTVQGENPVSPKIFRGTGSATLTARANNCIGAGPISVAIPLAPQSGYWCSNAYPEWCDCCDPPQCPTCPPYQLRIGTEDSTIISELSITPNPAQTGIQVVFPIEGEASSMSALLEIYDLTGKVWQSLPILNTNGCSLPVTDLPAGTYIVKVKAESREYTQKLQIIR